jgi:predicted O-linked N-acetylglucosamine transferase (SPINDLY family)
MERKPEFAEAGSNLLLALHFDPDRDARALLAEHVRWARQYAEPLAAEIRPHPNDRATDRPLRIGFVSPDFRDHPVGRLLLPLFAHHDRRQAEFVAYSDVRSPDPITARFRELADAWRPTADLDDSALADRVRGDRIDILVDLALHTAGNRLLVFARKPAPVQVSMLGLPSTTGLTTIDYRLTDPYFDPPGTSDGDYTERSIRLPHSIWCYDPPEDAPPVTGLPSEKQGLITFGCLNKFAKVGPPASQLWTKILECVPDSRLVIHCHPGTPRNAVRDQFRNGGIDPGRIAFAARAARPEYLGHYRDLDLSLDPFPFGGGITTLDSLWMGVPVITLAGRTGVGRGGVSILSNLGLSDLIAGTPEQYVEIAVGLANDRARLARLRAGLRAQQASVLMDGRRYAADVEAALRQMWREWCGR